MPRFIMMVGLPGSGKSTYAKKHFEDFVILESDALREELLGDAESQANNALIFSEMEKRAISALLDGRNVVYDATNIDEQNRKNLLSKLPCGVRKEAFVLQAPISVCLRRNASRSRHVPEAVIVRMARSLQRPTIEDGFDAVFLV